VFELLVWVHDRHVEFDVTQASVEVESLTLDYSS
jgi:hypothetical protein